MNNTNRQPLCIHQVVQTSSGGDHVTIYESSLEFTKTEGIVVTLETDAVVEAQYASQDALQSALDSIGEGVTRALDTRAVGAHIRVMRLVLHPIDFKPLMFRKLTEKAVTNLTHNS